MGGNEYMTKLEKLDAGLEYDFWDEGVNSRKLHAIKGCAKLNRIPVTEDTAREAAVRQLFGSVWSNFTVLPAFNCDNRKIFMWEKIFLPIIM